VLNGKDSQMYSSETLPTCSAGSGLQCTRNGANCRRIVAGRPGGARHESRAATRHLSKARLILETAGPSIFDGASVGLVPGGLAPMAGAPREGLHRNEHRQARDRKATICRRPSGSEALPTCLQEVLRRRPAYLRARTSRPASPGTHACDRTSRCARSRLLRDSLTSPTSRSGFNMPSALPPASGVGTEKKTAKHKIRSLEPHSSRSGGRS